MKKISFSRFSSDTLALLSGILLLLLLPAGMFDPIDGFFFQSAFFFHLIFFCWAVFLSLKEISLIIASTRFRWLFGVASAVILSVIILCALPPITAKDAVIHHLAVPKLWIGEGKIVPIPWHEWSYYPMLLQLAFTGFLSHGLEALTPFYHLGYLLLLASAVALFVKEESGDSVLSFLSFFLTISIPLCINLAATPLVDLGLAYYTAISCFSLCRWFESGRNKQLVFAGIALGLSLGCKPNAMLSTALLIPLTLWCGTREKTDLKVLTRAVLVVAVCSGLVYLPWLIRSYLWTGNPFFPLLKSWFGGIANPVATGAPIGLTPLLQRLMLYDESWAAILLLPIRIFVSGQDENPALFDGRLTPLLLISVFCVLKQRKNTHVMLFLFSLFYLLFALFLTGARVRYLGPIIGPLCFLSTMELGKIVCSVKPKTAHRFLTGFFIFQVLWAGAYSAELLNRTQAFDWLFSKTTKEEYLKKHVADYDLINFINKNTPSDSAIYLLYTGNRFYYFDRKTISAGYMSGNMIISWLKSCPSEICLLLKLKEQGATHIMAHGPRTQRALSEALTPDEALVWNAFQKNLVEPLYSSPNGYVLWRLKQAL